MQWNFLKEYGLATVYKQWRGGGGGGGGSKG